MSSDMIDTQEISDYIGKLESRLPKDSRKEMTDDIKYAIADMLNDTDMATQYRESILSYANILASGRYKIKDYLNAVKFVSFKNMDMDMKDAYELVFPEKVKKWKEDGRDDKAISSHISMYNKNQLVNSIAEQSMIPFYVLNMGAAQKALNVNIDLMYNGKSEFVRQKAADSVLAHTQQPQKLKIEEEVTVHHDVIGDYQKAIEMMVEAQKKAIANGGDIKAVTNAKIKPVEEIIEAETE